MALHLISRKCTCSPKHTDSAFMAHCFLSSSVSSDHLWATTLLRSRKSEEGGRGREGEGRGEGEGGGEGERRERGGRERGRGRRGGEERK